MDIKEIINKKSLCKKLTTNEINFFVNGYTNGEIPDYQMSALLMAIKINGMDESETFALTRAMLNSGRITDLSNMGFCVDKHSTGGISDNTTLILAPICASCGVKLFKLSGRGLGFTGGTVDKLESFEGFKMELSMEDATALVKKNNACVISASKDLAPADKKIYALRDCTSTVECLPLIASSIMSKKLASGADGIVLDVKYGNGAFMKTKKDALELANLMVKIGKAFGKKMDYKIGDMNQPLGFNIGNKLEAYEAIEVLSGKKGNLRNEALELAGKCISLSKNIPYKEALKLATNALDSKKALEQFKVMVKSQGGSLKLFNGLDIKPKLKIESPVSGTLSKIDCVKLGTLVGEMGARRKTIDGGINYNVGVKTFHKLGDKINKGDVLFELFADDKKLATNFKNEFLNCYTINSTL